MRIIKEKTPPKAKRGDIVVLEGRHSATDAAMQVTRWNSYTLAYAARCTRKGIVERVVRQMNGNEYLIDQNQRVLTIDDPVKQEAAWRLFTDGGVHRYDTAEEIRDAILAKIAPEN